MNGSVGILLCFFLAISLWATTEGLSVSVSPQEPQRLNPGASELKLTCSLDIGAMFLLKGKLNWFHKDSKGNLLQITEQGNILEDANHRIEFKYEPTITSSIIILSVGDAQNGEYICSVKESEEQAAIEKSVKIDILFNVDRMELSIDDHVVTMVQEEEVFEQEFDNRKTPLSCTSYGSSSETTLAMYMDDQLLSHEEQLNIMDEQATRNTPSYKSRITTHYKLMPTNKKLKCIASTDDFGDSEVSIKIHIITLEPLITCTNRSAVENDRYVKLECDVSSDRPIKQLYFQVGYNNQIDKFYPGNKTEDLTEVREKVDGNNRRVLLEIYKAEQRHFDSVFYLIVESSDGSIFKEPIFLREIGGNSCMNKSNLLLTLVACVIGVFTRWML